MREWIDIELTILTPAFIAGADQNDCEFRSASVRGLLRWWWRAAVGHECDMKSLADREGRLFGSTAEGLKSCIAVSVVEKAVMRMERASKLPDSGYRYQWRRQGRPGTADILPYLAYGPVLILPRDQRHPDGRAKDPMFNDRDGKAFKDPRFMRAAIGPGSKLTVRISWLSGRLSEGQLDEIVRAGCAWTTLGGIGSRSRKGWGLVEGSVGSAGSPELGEKCRRIWDAYRGELTKNGNPLPPKIPEFPQLAYRRVLFDNKSFDRWEQALGSIGMRYKEIIDRSSRWITGAADPRRASSVMISMVRDQARKFRPFVCLLPCCKSAKEAGDNEMRAFVQKFERLARQGS